MRLERYNKPIQSDCNYGIQYNLVVPVTVRLFDLPQASTQVCPGISVFLSRRYLRASLHLWGLQLQTRFRCCSQGEGYGASIWWQQMYVKLGLYLQHNSQGESLFTTSLPLIWQQLIIMRANDARYIRIHKQIVHANFQHLGSQPT